GIFAMRHKKRAIIISIDERAKGMGETYNLNLIDREDLNNLEKMINAEFITDVQVNFDVVNQWLKQFSN
ncbi:polysaccharide pyruvyl transferase family protein, partial [Bacillus toyonensis]|nr:polysaccharide pyruvyl transferase family protein [Bacillus toyonensis]